MERFGFLSSDGKTELAAYCIHPMGEVCGMIQIAHGMCEYFPRYEEFAEYLAQNGLLVFGHDHLGHGNSAKSENDLGFIASKGGANCMVSDILSLAKQMQKKHPNIPTILFGHSMGSFLSRAALTRSEAKRDDGGSIYAAAVICGTGGPDMPTGAGKLLANIIATFRGERHRSRLLANIAFAGYLSQIEKPCDKNAWLSRDPATVERYNADPKCGFTFTVRAYGDLFDAVSEVSRKDWATKMPNIPLLLISGEDDPVGSYGAGVKKVRDRLLQAGAKHTTCVLYPHMRHEILNEIDKESVWKETLEWLNRCLLPT